MVDPKAIPGENELFCVSIPERESEHPVQSLETLRPEFFE